MESSRIERVLRSRQSLRQCLAILKVAIGLPVSLSAGLVLGTIFWYVFYSIFDVHAPWTIWFIVLSAITIPLLFRLELKTGGDYLGAVARDTLPPSPSVERIHLSISALKGPLAGALFGVLSEPRVSGEGLTELFLFGPRLVIEGVRHLRIASHLAVVPYDNLVSIVSTLLGSKAAVPLRQLMRVHNQVEDLTVALAWLAYYDWARIAESLENVFLYTEARERLS